ncbi:MAG: Holliday junction branch migration protein RuvA [Pseudomonadota bacterium]
MIGYLEGRILHFESDGILLQVDKIGYEILLNPQIVETLKSQSHGKQDDDNICLYIYYHQTERQPKPVLIGFETLDDKEFFQTFITVDAIGPMKAVKAMTRSTGEIAQAIEQKDVSFLTGLSGIGKRTAEKIIASLHGKVEKFIATRQYSIQESNDLIPSIMTDISQQVIAVLVEQLGHSPASAKRMVKEAFERNNAISTPEALFDEIYQEGR